MYSVPITDPRRINMPPRETCCCFTGHRKLPWPLCEQLAQRLDLEIAWLAEHGCTNFIAGGALGFDTIAAEAVLRARKNDPDIRLYLFLPSPVQTSGWAWDDCERYQDICDAADAVHVLGTNNSAGCMMQRNRAMVDASAYVIAYYDPATQKPGVPLHGGTFRTIEYACSKRIPVTNLHDVSPDELPFRPEWYEPED